MSKDNFESIIGELMKGPANIESVNFHFGDCNSTTYMGGEVEEEYEEEYGCDDCGCCPGNMPVVDNDRVAEWVQKKTNIDLATIEKVLEAEMEYLEEIGAAIPVGTAGNGEDAQEQDGVAAGEDQPEQKGEPVQKDNPEQKDGPEQAANPEQAADPKADTLDKMLDKMLGDVMPGLLCMGLMGAILEDVFSSGEAGRKEQRDGKKE
ncbi:MAG: hypothetical protein LUE86_04805 [Clostridiales bacterium]|nr:hypothetical protein [Clostridiales bacterium]